MNRARNSEISFLRARRRAVQGAAVNASDDGVGEAQGAIPLPAGRWTDEQAAEVAVQKKKREHRPAQALQEGAALPESEITEEPQQADAALR